jgi:hypothetical protein
MQIPSQYEGKYRKLRPGRQKIISSYFLVRSKGSHVKQIVRKLHPLYTLDRHGWNSHVAKVVREFFTV